VGETMRLPPIMCWLTGHLYGLNGRCYYCPKVYGQ
jgi:hypothetical protein